MTATLAPGELTEREARRIIERVLDAASADETDVRIAAQEGGNLRFAANGATTSGEIGDTTVRIATTFGKRTGTIEVNEVGEDALAAAVRRAEEIAHASPKDPEHMPPLGRQRYPDVPRAHITATADIDAARRARAAGRAIDAAKGRDVLLAGFLQNAEVTEAIGNSAGNLGYQRRTWLTYSNTARTTDGAGSGWSGVYLTDADRLNTDARARVAIEKALASRTTKSLEPGVYRVVLEPSAVGSLVGLLLENMDARRADEGRSFLSAPGGGTRLGQRLLSDKVTIRTDPASPLAAGRAWAQSGIPAREVEWFRGGVTTTLNYDRYWASQKDVEPTPGPLNALMEGEDHSLEDLIRETDRGLLITRFWYIREVDPQTLLHTGLTRDGTFWIEDGHVSHAVNNFRWNESPVRALREVEMLSRPVPIGDVEAGLVPMVLPAVKAHAFTFSSVSQAV